MKAFALIAALLFCASSFAGEAKTVKLLTIGNSFSANATHYLGDLAKAGGHTLIHQPLVIGGASLQVHADKAQKHEAAPKDKAGLYTNGRGLKENLELQKWDYVTIQQASIKSHDFTTYQPYAGWLRDYITKHAPQAKLLVHETWEYRKDDPRFIKPGEPQSQEEMYIGLRAAYEKIAAEFNARIIPTGAAFHLADTDPSWAYQTDTSFNPKAAKQPELPNQTHSLHVGWRWAKPKNGGKIALSMDGHHANMAGEYLGACVWYEVLFGESAVGNTFIPKGLDPKDAAYLQDTAHRAVVERIK
ncbi:DUF4886 domain-containing protein [Prosthecobacter sp.]|uniref:DUF4886 domain-containing protein n=1 Tax=Prosthecobacter sp. TaxID=1965333 RepID=UPI002487C0BC|nr:DUF4886 domain-containing protein [Prosthecobacter sp.]MDI1313790.1 DUF4886 domain-containing protein [Prosthecobacter sp.]